jgi:hypothetical protein
MKMSSLAIDNSSSSRKSFLSSIIVIQIDISFLCLFILLMVSFKFYLGKNVSDDVPFSESCLIHDQTFYTNATLPCFAEFEKYMINVFIHGLSLTENQRTIEEIPREYSTHRLGSISYTVDANPFVPCVGGRTQILGSVISYMYVHGPVLISYVQCNFEVFDCNTVRRHFVCLYQKYNTECEEGRR